MGIECAQWRPLQGGAYLGHDTVICGHYQDNDVGDLGPPRAHGAEGRVARCIQECCAALQMWTNSVDIRSGLNIYTPLHTPDRPVQTNAPHHAFKETLVCLASQSSCLP